MRRASVSRPWQGYPRPKSQRELMLIALLDNCEKEIAALQETRADLIERIMTERSEQELAARERLRKRQGAPMIRKVIGAVAVCVLAVASVAEAQTVIPIRYRMTRTAPGQPTVSQVFDKSAMACNLPVGPVSGAGFRITDPATVAPNLRDCEQLVPATAIILASRVPGVTYAWTIAGQANDVDPYGPESTPFTLREAAIPTAPGNLRLVVPPGSSGVAVNGTVQEGPYGYAGLQVVRTPLDGGGEVFIGALSLSTPGYSVRRGDKVELLFYREP